MLPATAAEESRSGGEDPRGPPHSLDRGRGLFCGASSLQRCHFGTAAAGLLVEGIAEDREQPRLEAGAFLELFERAEGSHERLLQEIIRLRPVAHQEPGECPQVGQQFGDLRCREAGAGSEQMRMSIEVRSLARIGPLQRGSE